MARLTVGVAVTLATIAGPARAGAPRASLQMAPVSSAAALDREVEALVEQQKYSEAARLLVDELGRLPETLEHRARRNSLAILAVNVYRLEFDANAGECEAARAAIALADRYLAQLTAVYGEAALGSDEYVGMAESRAEFDAGLAARKCPTAVAPVTDDPGPAPPPAAQVQPDEPERRDRGPSERALKIGLGVSAGLTGALLTVSLVTGLRRYKDPFVGAAYEAIYTAAQASVADDDPTNDVPYHAGADMCESARAVDNADVTAACDRWDHLGRTAIATGVLTGVLAATTITLAVLLARDSRRRASAAASARLPVLGFAPLGRRGGMAALSWRF